jgi:hypothetical protein
MGPDYGALAAAHDAAVQMIDTSVVRVHQHAARRLVTDPWIVLCLLGLTASKANDNRLALKLLSRLRSESILLPARGYDRQLDQSLLQP